jgi:amino acid permease
LTFLATIWGDGVAFTWSVLFCLQQRTHSCLLPIRFINLIGVNSLFTWIAIAAINLRFRRAFKAQNRDLSDLPFRAPFAPFLALSTIVLGLLMFSAQGWSATTYGDTGSALAQDMLAVYVGSMCILLLPQYVLFS